LKILEAQGSNNAANSENSSLIANDCYCLGNEAVRRGLLDEARIYYEKAVQGGAITYYRLGYEFMKRGWLSSAMSFYDKALQGGSIGPYHIGCMFTKMGALNEAIGYFNKAIQENSRDALRKLTIVY